MAQENPVEQNYSCALCPFSTQIQHRLTKQLKTHSNDKPFKCPECPFKTRWKQDVPIHFKNVHFLRSLSSRPFPCPIFGCNYAAKEKSKLKQHSKIHSDEKLFPCSHLECKFSTNYRQTLILHTRVHADEKPFSCPFESCSYAARTSEHLLRHSRTHTKEKPYKCPEANCEYTAAERSTIKQHQLTHKPKEGEERPTFNCPLCEYSGKSKKNLSSHIKHSHTLEKFFKCDEPNCNFEAKTPGEIDSHKVVHSDKKPFACSFQLCGLRYKRKSHLSDHLKTHSDERRYKCELCPFRAKTRNIVTTHLRNVHSDPNFRPFKCTQPKCNYAAKTNGELKAHALIHKGDKKYSCPFPDCQFKAITKYNVKLHQKAIHETGKAITCSLCPFATKTKSNLTVHMRTHTRETPLICKEKGCKYRAKQSVHLKNHQKRSHPSIFKQEK